MRRRWLLLALIATVGCGNEPDPTQARIDALLQRLDAMDRRLDELEEARAQVEASTPPPIAAAESSPRAFNVRLPRADHAPGEPATSLRVHVRTDGLQIDGKEVTLTAAAERFEQAVSERPDTRLVLLAEPKVPHETVVRVLDLAKEAGLEDVAMSARVHAPDEGDP